MSGTHAHQSTDHLRQTKQKIKQLAFDFAIFFSHLNISFDSVQKYTKYAPHISGGGNRAKSRIYVTIRHRLTEIYVENVESSDGFILRRII